MAVDMNAVEVGTVEVSENGKQDQPVVEKKKRGRPKKDDSGHQDSFKAVLKTEIVKAEKPLVPEVDELTQSEAITIASEIKSELNAIGESVLSAHAKMLSFREHNGHKALGYETWRECCEKEFGQTVSAINFRLQAARAAKQIALEQPGSDVQDIPASHLRAVGRLPENQQGKALKDAEKLAAKRGERFTASHVKEVVEKKLGLEQVNGDTLDDVKEDLEEREAIQEEISDLDYPKQFPLYEKLKGDPHKIFVSDSLFYRRVEQARDDFKVVATEAGKLHHKESKTEGAYASSVRQFLSKEHPKNWKVCPESDKGGCGGEGLIPGVGGACPRCKGRGYIVS